MGTMSALPSAPTRGDRRDRQAPQNNNVKGDGDPAFSVFVEAEHR